MLSDRVVSVQPEPRTGLKQDDTERCVLPLFLAHRDYRPRRGMHELRAELHGALVVGGHSHRVSQVSHFEMLLARRSLNLSALVTEPNRLVQFLRSRTGIVVQEPRSHGLE